MIWQATFDTQLPAGTQLHTKLLALTVHCYPALLHSAAAFCQSVPQVDRHSSVCVDRVHAVSGCLAGLASVLALQPLDVVKTRLQGGHQRCCPCSAPGSCCRLQGLTPVCAQLRMGCSTCCPPTGGPCMPSAAWCSRRGGRRCTLACLPHSLAQVGIAANHGDALHTVKLESGMSVLCMPMADSPYGCAAMHLLCMG